MQAIITSIIQRVWSDKILFYKKYLLTQLVNINISYNKYLYNNIRRNNQE